MSAENKKEYVDSPNIVNLGYLQDKNAIIEVANIYFKRWNELGLCDTPEEALKKIKAFCDNTYVLMKPGGEIIAAVNTVFSNETTN